MIMKKLLSIGIVVLMIFCFSGCKERYEPAPQITEGKFPLL
jgi:PBP1b-binding outer membrane lipoprotein LpoB